MTRSRLNDASNCGSASISATSSSTATTSSATASTSRLEALAQPGTVCISQTVYERVKNKLDLDYRPLGSHRVKNIAEPVRAYAVGVPAAAPRPRRGRRVLVAGAGAAALVVAGLIAWAVY